MSLNPPPAPNGESLPQPLRSPRCSQALTRDLLWSSPHWICPASHSYSNAGVLRTELHERGWLSGTERKYGQGVVARMAEGCLEPPAGIDRR